MAQATEWFKVVVVGECLVGKTWIVHTQKNGKKMSKTAGPSKAANKTSITLDMQAVNCKVTFDVFDIPGKEAMAPLQTMYIRDAHAAIVVYDITDANSLRSAEKWIEVVKDAGPSEIVMVMAGNKMDTNMNKHKVPMSDAMNVARQNGILHC